MKNLISILFLCFSITTFGQIEKPITQGHILIGGDFSGEFEKADSRKVIDIIATPNFGYFVANNLAIGMALPIRYLTIVNVDEYSSIGVGPYLKYYFNNGIFMSFVASGSIENQNTNSSNSYIGYSYTTKTISLSPGIGYGYFITNNLSLEGGLFYEYSKTFGDNSISHPELNILRFKFGFQIFL